MGYNYNGKLRSAELLLREDGSVDLIRRAETLEDYFATWCGKLHKKSATALRWRFSFGTENQV